MVILFIIILVIRPDSMIVQYVQYTLYHVKYVYQVVLLLVPTWALGHAEQARVKTWILCSYKNYTIHRVERFFGGKTGFRKLCQIVWDPNSKFHFEMLLFNLAQGLRKLLHTNFVTTVFGACTRTLGGNVFVDLLKLKMKRHSFLWLGKKQLLPFWGPQQKFFNI